MKDKRWLREKDPTKLLLKLHEEVGEVTHAFMRGNNEEVAAEIRDVQAILDSLGSVVAVTKLESVRYGNAD